MKPSHIIPRPGSIGEDIFKSAAEAKARKDAGIFDFRNPFDHALAAAEAMWADVKKYNRVELISDRALVAAHRCFMQSIMVTKLKPNEIYKWRRIFAMQRSRLRKIRKHQPKGLIK